MKQKADFSFFFSLPKWGGSLARLAKAYCPKGFRWLTYWLTF